jgi:MarR family transcriptional regulator, temperature-dependent positive regulator of motility
MRHDKNNRLNRSVIHLLHRAGQSAAVIFHGEMTTDLTPRQLAVLMAVAQNEGLNQSELVEGTGIDRSTVGDIVRRLVERGLLQRRRTGDDARAYAVKLTKDGRRVLDRTEPVAKRVDERVLNSLPARQREEFVAALLAIVETLERVTPQGEGNSSR